MCHKCYDDEQLGPWEGCKHRSFHDSEVRGAAYVARVRDRPVCVCVGRLYNARNAAQLSGSMCSDSEDKQRKVLLYDSKSSISRQDHSKANTSNCIAMHARSTHYSS